MHSKTIRNQKITKTIIFFLNDARNFQKHDSLSAYLYQNRVHLLNILQKTDT